MSRRRQGLQTPIFARFVFAMMAMSLGALGLVGCSAVSDFGGAPLGGLSRLSAKPSGMTIEKVVSPGGVSAWLVREPAVPIIAVEAGFIGGASNDPTGRAGLASLMSALLTEGAGDMEATAFQRRLQELNMSLGGGVSRDETVVSMRTLSVNRDAAFEMLRLAVNEPRFDRDAVERVRDQIVVGLKRSDQNPNAVASRLLWRTVFPEHPYGRPTGGAPAEVERLTPAMVRDRHRRALAKDVMRIAVVGDITPEELGPLLDSTFGALPETADTPPIPAAAPLAEGRTVIERFPAPQTAILFAAPGLTIDDPDFIPAFVMLQIWGGGGLTSRLVQEVRGARGLAYSVSAGLAPLREAGIIYGLAGTQNARAGETVDIIRAELKKIAATGVTAAELNDAKTYLTGSYPLRFDSNSKIANQLVGLQLQGYDAGYVNRRNSLIEAVTLADIQRAADRLMRNDALTFVLVGQPEDLSDARRRIEREYAIAGGRIDGDGKRAARRVAN
ncbi:MAG: pitrilysin family protein [Pseudomonadota bacterium]